ncbi:MAG: GtrA family protein [Anaerolineae bacterium]
MTAGTKPIGATDRLPLPSLSILAQAGKFMAVGVLNTLIDAATYFMLTRWTFLSVLPVWAKGISYVVGMVNSFFWNRTWTFRSRSNPWHAAGLFTLTHVAALGINAGTMALALQGLHLPELVALGLATGASFVWNFVLNKWVVFR